MKSLLFLCLTGLLTSFCWATTNRVAALRTNDYVVTSEADTIATNLIVAEVTSRLQGDSYGSNYAVTVANAASNGAVAVAAAALTVETNRAQVAEATLYPRSNPSNYITLAQVPAQTNQVYAAQSGTSQWANAGNFATTNQGAEADDWWTNKGLYPQYGSVTGIVNNILSVGGYATQGWVTGQLGGYYTTANTNGYINAGQGTNIAQNVASGYVPTNDPTYLLTLTNAALFATSAQGVEADAALTNAAAQAILAAGAVSNWSWSTFAPQPTTNYLGPIRQDGFEDTWTASGTYPNYNTWNASGWTGAFAHVESTSNRRVGPPLNNSSSCFQLMTNGAFVASPVLPSGIGTIYFQAGLIVGGSGTIMVQVSTNNGANWIVLQTYTITGSGSAWNDISPAIQLNLRVPAMVQIVETNTIFSQQIILDNIAITYPGYVEIGSSASQLTGCPSGAVATTDTRYLAALTNVAAFDPAGAAAVVQTNLNAVGATQAVNTATISVLLTNSVTPGTLAGYATTGSVMAVSNVAASANSTATNALAQAQSAQATGTNALAVANAALPATNGVAYGLTVNDNGEHIALYDAAAEFWISLPGGETAKISLGGRGEHYISYADGDSSDMYGCPSGADPAGAAAVVQTNLNAVGATQAVNTATISVLTTNTATLAYVVGVSNGAIAVSAAAITAATNGLVTASVTNGLASTAALVSGLTAGSNYAVTVANAASNVLSAVWQPGTPIHAASGTATIYYASGPLVSLVCTAATTIVVDPARAGYGSTNGLNQQVLMLLQATNSVSWGAAGNTFAIPYTLTATNAWTRYMIDCIGTNTFSVYGGLQ
jgi:hypothetical protein